MQYTAANSDDILNTIPEHFPQTLPLDNALSPKIEVKASGPPQNVSFSASYTSSRFGNVSSQQNINNSLKETHKTKPLLSFAILNIDDLSGPYSAKPNAIVRPFPRPEQPLPGPLRINGSECRGPQLQDGQAEGSFANELSRKLRFLHTRGSYEWLKLRKIQKNASKLDTISKRPLFITTVPTGIFLPPAKDPPIPTSFRRRIYAYSSYPVVFNDNYSHSPLSTLSSKDKNRANTASVDASDKMPKTQRTSSLPQKEFKDDEVACHREIRHLMHTSYNDAHLPKQQFQKQIHHNRAKRETPTEPYKNIMHERRVIRGSNYGGTNLLVDIDPLDKAAEIRRRQAIRRRTQSRNQRNILGTPPPVKGRCHEVVQTEKYLEELIERPPGYSVDTQTDLFLERPPTPPYVPTKVSVDASTEIVEEELFYYDTEVQSIISVFIDACIEQSILEVSQENELDAIRKKKEEFLVKRESEFAELQRLENDESLTSSESKERKNQEKGMTAAKLLQGHIAALLPEVLESIEPATDAARKEKLMTTICPWLTKEVAEEVGQIVDSREILTVIIQEIIKQRATNYVDNKEEEPESKSHKSIYSQDEVRGESKVEHGTSDK